MGETKVLCGANAYEEKYYLNPEFEGLPGQVKEELQILCVLFTEEVGGVFVLSFDGEGILHLRAEAEEGDLLYDEIGSGLKIKQIQREQEELLRGLELYYRIFFLKNCP